MKKTGAVLQRKGVVDSSRWQRLAANPTSELPFAGPRAGELVLRFSLASAPRPIEDESFPFEVLSAIGERESWRKEINRPTTHIHKWWAQRLGTVFRALLIGTFAPAGANILDLFYKPVRIPDSTVFDPFMGSGTTLAETIKLGGRAVGRDINAVAYFLVKCALSIHDRKAILDTFRAIERDVADEIRGYYRTLLSDGQTADVLYSNNSSESPPSATPR